MKTTIQLTPQAQTVALAALTRFGAGRGADPALAIARMKVAIQRVSDVAEKERTELIRQFDPSGQGWQNDGDAPPEFRAALAKWLRHEYDVELRPLSLEVLRSSPVQPEAENAGDLGTLIYLGLILDDIPEDGPDGAAE